MESPTVDIILVSYNTVEDTLKALHSVYDETQKFQFSITVVDNNSQDGSAQKIEEEFPDVSLIESKENLGFAGGVNLAARQSKADYLLLLNPDTIVLDGAIDKLLLFAKDNPKHGIWGGITLNNDLSINTHNAWAQESISTLFFSAFGLNRLFKSSCFFNHANYGCWKRDSIRTVDTLQGSFFLISQNLWNKLEGLDENFFMYAEEADFCYRARQQGYQPIITPNAKIIHHGGNSEVNLSGKMIKLLTGKITFINKHHSLIKQLIMKSLLLLHVINKLLLSAIKAIFSDNKKPMQKEWWKVFRNSPAWLKGYI